MTHAKVKFSKACGHGEDDVAKEFEDKISELYYIEEGYRLRGLSEEDIAVEPQAVHYK